MSFESHSKQIQQHKQLHYTTYTNKRPPLSLRGDYSCYICYPPRTETTDIFLNFWNWIFRNHSADTYTKRTESCFDQFISAYNNKNLRIAQEWLKRLVYTIRYRYSPESEELLVKDILKTALYTSGFSEDPEIKVLEDIAENIKEIKEIPMEAEQLKTLLKDLHDNFADTTKGLIKTI